MKRVTEELHSVRASAKDEIERLHKAYEGQLHDKEREILRLRGQIVELEMTYQARLKNMQETNAELERALAQEKHARREAELAHRRVKDALAEKEGTVGNMGRQIDEMGRRLNQERERRRQVEAEVQQTRSLERHVDELGRALGRERKLRQEAEQRGGVEMTAMTHQLEEMEQVLDQERHRRHDAEAEAEEAWCRLDDTLRLRREHPLSPIQDDKYLSFQPRVLVVSPPLLPRQSPPVIHEHPVLHERWLSPPAWNEPVRWDRPYASDLLHA